MAKPTESETTVNTRSSPQKPDFVLTAKQEKIGAETESVKNRSYVAMVLSALLPGLGQLYLRQPLKGFFLFLIFVSALGMFYLNSMPVKDWSDLTRFKPVTKEDISTDNTEDAQKHFTYAIHIWTFDDGKKLMYRPSWKLKISGSIQGILCWLYAIGSGWRGRRSTRKG